MRSTPKMTRRLGAGMLALAFALVACSDDKTTPTGGATPLAGVINADGSSTVFPIMEAVSEEFGKLHTGVRVPVGESGTGGGFEKFCKDEIDISNASRPIKDEEKAACAAKGVQFTEFKIAFDGLTLMTNKDIKVDCLTVEELKKAWIAGSKVQKFSDIRAGLPDTKIKFYGPGADSGTYDYFLEEILGKEAKYRDLIEQSEDDNVLVDGISESPGGFGFFGYSYYAGNKEKFNLVGVDAGKGCIKPSVETIRDGSYDPLSRPLFIYVKSAALARTEVQEFVKYMLTAEGRKLISEVGYVELPDADYTAGLAKVG